MWAYFDSSALVKRYVVEAGRRDVLRLSRRYACVTSTMSPIELRSGVRRRVAEGTLATRRLSAILEHMTTDRAYWTLVEVRADVLASAETLAGTHPLRALDSIHVASATRFAARLAIPDLPFVTADHRQSQVAAAIGLSVIQVG